MYDPEHSNNKLRHFDYAYELTKLCRVLDAASLGASLLVNVSQIFGYKFYSKN